MSVLCRKASHVESCIRRPRIRLQTVRNHQGLRIPQMPQLLVSNYQMCDFVLASSLILIQISCIPRRDLPVE